MFKNLTKEEKLIEEKMHHLKPISQLKKEKINTIIEKAKKNKTISLLNENNAIQQIP